MSEKKRILIGIPTRGMLGLDWFHSFLKTWTETLQSGKYDLGLIMPKEVAVNISDIKIVEKAFEEKWDYILRMDDDISDFSFKMLEQLVEADKDMVGAVMYTRNFPYAKCAFRFTRKNDNLIDVCKRGGIDKLREVYERGVQPVDLVAFAFILFKTQLFKELPKPWFVCQEDAPEDSYFCQKMLDAGKQPYAHCDLSVTHAGVHAKNKNHLLAADYPQLVSKGKVTFIGRDGKKVTSTEYENKDTNTLQLEANGPHDTPAVLLGAKETKDGIHELSHIVH